MPRITAKRLAEDVTRKLNLFPEESRISDVVSPLAIVTRGSAPDARAFPLDFGVHVETFDDNGWFQNSNRTKLTLVVALGPSLYREPAQIFTSLVTTEGSDARNGQKCQRHSGASTVCTAWDKDRCNHGFLEGYQR